MFEELCHKDALTMDSDAIPYALDAVAAELCAEAFHPSHLAQATRFKNTTGSKHTMFHPSMLPFSLSSR